ncbi:hypothetical protein ABH942_001830 [Flavobacterium sp. 28YEA47A]|uniref:DUF4421 family protein n=1 Tax=Flavobacterium sp. 28YEA47A TaxID=3156276 RepID=UPI0035157996
MVKKYAIFFIVFYTFFCQAQIADTLSTQKAQRSIEKYDDYIKLRLGLSNSFNSFRIKDKTSRLDFTLSPNQRLRSTLTLIYKFIEIDLGYTPEFLRFNKDDAIKGHTKFYNFGTRLYLGSWMQELQYARTKGFYIDGNDVGSEQNILFPHFQVQKIGGSTSYIFNPDFSFRTIFLQSEWQQRSAGSFVPSISYYFTQIKNNNPSKDNIFDIAIGPGYYYNWIIRDKFLVSAGAYSGLGFNSTKTVYNDGTPHEISESLSFQAQFRLTAGYNSEHFFAGAATSLNSFSYSSDTLIHVEDQQQFLEFYIGYRFKAPKRINSLFEKK